MRSTIAASIQNASSSSACTSNSVDVIRFIPWQYPTRGFRLPPRAVISTYTAKMRRENYIPAICKQHAPQLVHTRAVAPEEYIQRHRAPNVLLDLTRDPVARVALCEQVLKRARLLHLQRATRLKPHLRAVHKRHPTAHKPFKRPPLAAARRKPELGKPYQPIAVRELVVLPRRAEPKDRRRTTAPSRCCRRRRAARLERPHAAALLDEGVPLTALRRLLRIVDLRQLVKKPAYGVSARVARSVRVHGEDRRRRDAAQGDDTGGRDRRAVAALAALGRRTALRVPRVGVDAAY